MWPEDSASQGPPTGTSTDHTRWDSASKHQGDTTITLTTVPQSCPGCVVYKVSAQSWPLGSLSTPGSSLATATLHMRKPSALGVQGPLHVSPCNRLKVLAQSRVLPPRGPSANCEMRSQPSRHLTMSSELSCEPGHRVYFHTVWQWPREETHR